MTKGVTLADIAVKVGVSTVAVSKALSGKPGVSDEMRMNIKRIADEMGYISKKANRDTHVETGNIGVIIPENYYGYSYSFYGQMYEKVVRTLYDYNYFGILELLTKEDEVQGNMPKVMIDEKVDGLILLGPMEEIYIKKMVKQTELPVYFLDTYLPGVTIDTVISDGYYGMYALTNYLIRMGHNRIGYVGTVDATSSIADRYWGYRRALRESGIEYKEEWEIPDRDEKGKCFNEIIKNIDELQALVCNSDYTAHLVMVELEDKGFRIPKDISVVGFDDFLPGELDSNRITTYGVDVESMSQVCVKSLIKKIKHKKYADGVRIVTGKIIYKQSVQQRER